jgi:uncharacterized protein YehS (DUF1456 family)
MIAIFALADHTITKAELISWLRKEDDEHFKNLSDKLLATFLNGLINEKRGKKEGAQVEPEKKLTNNIIFTKLKIALNLKSDDILAMLDLSEFRLSKHELSAFFRKPNHKHYRECKDQVLRNFLNGVQLKYRDNQKTESEKEAIANFEWNKPS